MAQKTFLLTALAGLIGLCLGEVIDLEGALGVVLAIATAGACIARAIEEKK